MSGYPSAKRFLEMVEGGMGFDEIPDGEGGYTPRYGDFDHNMTAARHAALAVCASMNIRFDIGEKVEEGPARNAIVDEITEIIRLASGPGPHSINTALLLNQAHRLSELHNVEYGVGVEDGQMEVYLGNEDQMVETFIPPGEIEEDSLFSALKYNLAEFKVKSPE